MNKYVENPSAWTAPVIPEKIPQGDMPGDKIEIGEDHINKANLIFRELLGQIRELKKEDADRKIVLTVCGGSGVGKSETASLLSFYFNQIGMKAYTLSGDNYPHRIPKYNDAERLHVFRESAIRGMVKDGTFTKERFDIIHERQIAGMDADPKLKESYDWYESYLENGKTGLRGYLGTLNEIDFKEVEEIVESFKNKAEKIWLKRMGREDTELWYEEVDFSDTEILIIEWTHGNSDNYKGVDSPFTTLVLELEQDMLESQAHKAKVIVSKAGKLLSYDEYKEIMDQGRI